ncbi:hypothetical protein NCR_03068 [Burkholderia pseudomallei]
MRPHGDYPAAAPAPGDCAATQWRAAHPHTASPPDASSHARPRGFAASHANPPFATRDDHDQPGRGRITTHFIDLRDNLPV